MNKEVDVLIIGGGPAGIVAATTSKKRYPDKKIMLVKREKQSVVPCGIPYTISKLGSTEKNLINDAVFSKSGIELLIDEVVKIEKEEKACITAGGDKIKFDKLILALGSHPVKPQIEGIDLENIFLIPKNKDYLDNFINKLDSFKKIVVVGAGFIGCEVSDELANAGKDVTIVELMPQILGAAFDEDIAVIAQKELEKKSVKIKCGVKVKGFSGKGKVEKVVLDNGEELECDAVIVSVGYRPNSELAEKSGLRLNEYGFIVVDEYMRACSHRDIFAVGDCAEKRDFFTRRLSRVMLASTASSEARIAGVNLYNLSIVKTFGGTIGIFSTVIGNLGFATAGLTEDIAKKEGFDIISAKFEGIDRHPGTIPDVSPQIVKLIVAKESGIILGGEVVSGKSVGELINLIGFIVQNKMTVNSIMVAQIGTHPLLTSAPTSYPLIKAAEIAEQKYWCMT